MTSEGDAWPLCRWSDAAQLVKVIDPTRVPPDAAGVPPAQWFARLRQDKRTVDAVNFLAHAMPRYECVLWAARALIEGEALDPRDPLALAVLRWTDAPDDALRRAAGEAADASDGDGPGELLCRAVFVSGGSLAPVDLPPVQPRPDICARLAAGAVLAGAYRDGNPDPVIDSAYRIGTAMLADS